MLERYREQRVERKSKVLEIIEKAGKPVSIEYVAYHLGVSWHVARALLLELAAEGKIKMIDTTKSFVFSVPEKVKVKDVVER
ncbi:MAG: FaeA/PapI family transcriptional regulator [Candidatus Bathyarchaeia archaeon]